MSDRAAGNVPRRAFLGGLGVALGGLVIGVRGGVVHAAPVGATAAAAAAGFDANAFVHLGSDGLVTIVCARSEIGQGVRSSLHVVVADELGADLARVRVVQGDGDKKYGDQNTDGSRSVRNGFDGLRRAGAAARTVLVATAAKRWGVPAKECVARDHQVVHEATRRQLGFAALVSDAAKLAPVDLKTVTLRPRAELKHLGQRLPLLDGPDIVTGRAIYAADVKVEGMLTAVVRRPPVVMGRVTRFDGRRALAVPGVRKVVELPAPTGAPRFQPLGGVAVIADHTWAAMRGCAALDITWDDGPNGIYDSDTYREGLTAVIRKPGKTARNVGDVEAALKGAVRVIAAEYHVPHLAHAPMEPPAAVARVTAEGCEVWATTQDPQTARREVAQALGLTEDKVTVHVTLVGGGFGRKSKCDFIVEAALLSRAAGAPVRLQWTREDDLRHGYYHAVSAQRVEAGLDAAGQVVAWRHRTAFPPIPSTFDTTQRRPSDGELGQGLLDLPLAVPNVRVEGCEAEAHVRIGWLRSVCNIFHAFAINSFVDELAQARGKDTKDTWLELLGSPRPFGPKEAGVAKIPNYGASLDVHPVDVTRYRDVLERVTRSAGWGARAALPAGQRALGLGLHRSFLSVVGVVVALERRDGGPNQVPFRIDEVWITIDAGTVVNEDRVRAQMEGAVVFGASIALHGEITMKKGAVMQSSLRDYRLVRLPEAPRKIHVEIVPSEAPPCGVGEPGVPPVAPAIANALFALTGKRHRTLPLRAG